MLSNRKTKNDIRVSNAAIIVLFICWINSYLLSLLLPCEATSSRIIKLFILKLLSHVTKGQLLHPGKKKKKAKDNCYLLYIENNKKIVASFLFFISMSQWVYVIKHKLVWENRKKNEIAYILILYENETVSYQSILNHYHYIQINKSIDESNITWL